MKHECKHDQVTIVDAGGVETCTNCQMTRRNSMSPWMPGIGVRCLHVHATYFPGKYKLVCPKCNHELKDGSAKWEPIMAIQCSGCSNLTGPDSLIQGNEAFCPDCIPHKCKHLNAMIDHANQIDHCPDCGKIKPQHSSVWKGPALKCSDCGDYYEYKGRWPLPDMIQPRCPQCCKKQNEHVANLVFPKKTWDQKFFGLCDEIATWSKDPSTQLGCVIVGPDHEIRSIGYNGIPRGCKDNIPERYERPLKYRYFAHAEENAIANAARVGIPLKGCVIYCQWPPCDHCIRMIIGAGIKEVKCKSEEIPDRRIDEVIAAMEMLIEADVMLCDAGTILKQLKERKNCK